MKYKKTKNGNGMVMEKSQWNRQTRQDSKKTISDENANFNTEFQMENSTVGIMKYQR